MVVQACGQYRRRNETSERKRSKSSGGIHLRRLEMRVTRPRQRSLESTSQSDSLHLAQRNLVLCPVVEFGCSRRLMGGYLLGVLEPPIVFQINRDASYSPSVTSDRGEKTREANFADRFGVSRSTLHRNAAGPESPKMLMMGSQTERHGHPGGHDGRRLGPRAAGPG
jgi:hypothetical protein